MPSFAAGFSGSGESKPFAIGETVTLRSQVLGEEPGLPHAYSSLGRCHRLRGEIAAARRCYEEALRIAPEDAEARAALAELK